eukprot:87198_1
MDQKYTPHQLQKQLTPRSITIGLFLGCILCFSNTYFGLQTGWVTMGSLQSALAGYGMLQLCTRLNIGGEANKLELNMIQTIAVASATMPLSAGFVGIIPALALLNHSSGGPVTLTLSQLLIWTLSLASFGVFVAVPLRKYMIIKEQLPFPSGTATAKMIELFYHDTLQTTPRTDQQTPQEDDLTEINRTSLADQWKVLLFTFIVSSLITLTEYSLPILHYAPVFGSTANIYLWNVDLSLSYVGQGMIAGTRVGCSMFLGCIIGWAALGPYAISKDWAKPNSQTDDRQNSEQGWLLWVSLSIMLGESLTSLCVLLTKTMLHIVSGRKPKLPDETNIVKYDEEIALRVWMPGLIVSCVFCIVSLSMMVPLQLEWYEAGLALAFALIISMLSVRALGETDMNPVSGVGKVSQIFFSLIAPGNVIGNLVAGAMSGASAAQSGDMLQSFKTGHLLSASSRLQFYGALIGSIASVAFSVFAYYLFTSAYPDMPNAEFEVPAAELWLDMAELLNGESIATDVKWFCVGGAAIGALLSICHDVLFVGTCEYIPSGVAVAIGFYITPNYVIPRVIGSLSQFLWQRWNRNSFDRYMIVMASGFVLGEGVFSIVNAVMKAADVPSVVKDIASDFGYLFGLSMHQQYDQGLHETQRI